MRTRAASRDGRRKVAVLRERALALTLALLAACSAADQPAPTASAPAPAAVVADVETGMLDGAEFRIDVPRAPLQGLVVWFHGYAITPVRLPAGEALAPQLQQFVARGYAVAQSAYSATGWAVEQGAADGERLRRHFSERHGVPRQTIAAGMSMGGTLTVLALETHPGAYAGGLSLCGAIERSDRLLHRDFLLLTAVEHYFPDLLGPLLEVPAGYLPTPAAEQRIAAALRAKPEAAAALLRLWGVGDAHTLGDIIAFNYYEIGELQRRAHGNPFANADYIYTGTGDDRALNDGVHRYRADPAAAAYVARWYSPSGNLERPLLALHDTGDPLVPASGASDYALATQRAGRADRFVQQYVNRDGHCVFTPQEVGRAFDELVAWMQDGKRPAPGALPPR